jgi:tetratricopeptide (TPR) repeat protein
VKATVFEVENEKKESAAAVIKHIIKKSSLQEAIKKFQEIKVDSQDKYSFNETEFNSLGYWLISRGKIKEAIAVFKMNIEMFPKSANVHDSLGEAYLYSGDKIRAIISYKKSLEMNPENNNAQKPVKYTNMPMESKLI